MTKCAIFRKSIANGAGEIHHWLVAAGGRKPRLFKRLASRVRNPRRLATVLLWYGISAAYLFWLSTQVAAVFWPNAAILAVCFAIGRLIARPGQG